jgi:hypothetical protein
MSHALDGRIITCPVCGKRGGLYSGKSDHLARVYHVTPGSFIGQVSGQEIPMMKTVTCDIRDHVEEILKKEMPQKKVGRR